MQQASEIHFGFTNMGSDVRIFRIIAIWISKFWFGSPCIHFIPWFGKAKMSLGGVYFKPFGCLFTIFKLIVYNYQNKLTFPKRVILSSWKVKNVGHSVLQFCKHASLHTIQVDPNQNLFENMHIQSYSLLKYHFDFCHPIE